jgi:adenine-specific DNA-methyltransferase
MKNNITQTKLHIKNMEPLRFIGSKFNLLSNIENIIKQHCGNKTDYVVGDLFSGTSVVSKHFKQLGYSVVANDNLEFCHTLAKSSLLNNKEPKFLKLLKSKRFPKDSASKIHPIPYEQVLYYLNNLPAIKGFIYREYSPGGSSKMESPRKYFTDKNAQKIDAVRSTIQEWENGGLLSSNESALLISDLLRATNKIANIAGTYGSFLKHWDPRTNNSLFLSPSKFIKSIKNHAVYCENANDLVKKIKFDIVYLDPPYTWRHYGAYYHILETITKWDKPKTKGISGLRPWKNSKSKFCYRNEAADALKDLIHNCNTKHLLISYNSEGLISHDEIYNILSQIGKPFVHEIQYRKYKSNNGTKEKTVTERIYYVKKRI